MALEEQLDGLSPEFLQKIGVITILSGNTEFWLERAIWALTGENVVGIRPSTDTKPVSALIDILSETSQKINDPEYARMMGIWVQIATPAFKCRNTIFHGIGVSFEPDSMNFITNTHWKSEVRKRDSASFTADNHTLGLLNKVFYTARKSIIGIEKIAQKELDIKRVSTDSFMRELTDARSTANEIVDLTAAINNEKY